MKTLRTKKEISSFIDLLKRRAGGASPEIIRRVEKILNDVRKKGDRAVIEYTERFDGFRPKSLRIPPSAIKRHASAVDKKVLAALRLSEKRIRRFHARQKESSWTVREEGITLGQIIRPLERVGVYVPGGKASYPSTVLMNVIPAQVAGVKEIALTVPTPKGEVNPSVMAVIELLGVKEVYAVGGAQAVAALAYGTESIRRVDKIAGPGNIYVAAAKRMVFGDVDIDMIAGPSEILIIADDTARPDFIASDLLSQAEHDELASPVLVTDSERIAADVRRELMVRLNSLRRRDIAAASLKNYGAVILVKDMAGAVEISNTIAPEHLELMVKNPKRLLPMIKNAGAIFLGSWSPETVGDYSAGPNHTLPTGGTARFSSPLGVYDFIKRSSLLEFTKKGFMRLAKAVETIADAEGLEAHANAARVRK
ncbi:MAG: histidinol dehydrogenase [Thermodesulfovibrionales bacterium]|nr:histidinol dehydrogenase [Thermodesulfovibrionales bacterium]